MLCIESNKEFEFVLKPSFLTVLNVSIHAMYYVIRTKGHVAYLVVEVVHHLHVLGHSLVLLWEKHVVNGVMVHVHRPHWLDVQSEGFVVFIHTWLFCHKWVYYLVHLSVLLHWLQHHYLIAKGLAWVLILAYWSRTTTHKHGGVCKVVMHRLVWRNGLDTVRVISIHVAHVWEEHAFFRRFNCMCIG